ncbi:MAG: hypothetical protein ABSF65_03250 [Candidatus Bathyarchaeia archaeon]|jgi:predicted transcriptional regulator
MGQITFSIDPELEEAFRKQAGIRYGGRKDCIGVATRQAIREFLVNSDTSIETAKRGET